MAMFTTVTFKALSDQVWTRYAYFVCSNCIFSFGVSLQKCLAHFLILSTNGEIHKTKLLQVNKTKLSSTFLIRLSFQGYRYKWGFALFEWKVTWNYAYSPFNGICRMIFFLLFFRLSMEKVRQVLIENLFPCTILPAVQMLVNNGEIPTNLYRNFLYDCSVV